MEVILESKNKRIRIKEIVGNIGKTYSIYLDGKCQSKLIKEKTFNDLKNNLNLQEEVNKLSENLNNNIYLHLIDLMYEKLIDENGFDIKEAKTEIYTSKMLEILPFLEEFFPSHYVLGGGTAIALHLGHRESIDFDFLIQNPKEFENFNVKNFLKFFQDKGFDASIDYNTDLQMDFSINGVKTTILNVSGNLDPLINNYIEANYHLDNFYFKIPSLKTLGAMKLYAMSFRKKNKDYYDLFFILKQYKIEELFNDMVQFYGFTNNIKNLIKHLGEFGEYTEEEKINWKVDGVPNEAFLKKFFKEQQEKVNKYLI